MGSGTPFTARRKHTTNNKIDSSPSADDLALEALAHELEKKASSLRSTIAKASNFC